MPETVLDLLGWHGIQNQMVGPADLQDVGATGATKQAKSVFSVPIYTTRCIVIRYSIGA